MFFKTWGENINSGLDIGLIGFLIGIPLVIVTIGLTLAMGPAGLLVGAILIGLLIAAINAAVGAVGRRPSVVSRLSPAVAHRSSALASALVSPSALASSSFACSSLMEAIDSK